MKKGKKEEKFTVKHILVALDTSRHSRAALEAAVTLAKSLEAELQGLFVEDITWFRISKQPFSYEVSDLTGTIRFIEHKDIEREVKVQAARLKKLMDEIGKKSNVKYSFKSVRGGVEEELLTAIESADLITLGRLGRSFKKHTDIGKTAKTIINQSKKPVLILQYGWHIGRKNIVIYDGSDTSKKGLIIAQQMVRKQGNRLLILVQSKTLQEKNNRLSEIEAIFNRSDFSYQIGILESNNLDDLNKLIKKQEGGILIIPKNNQLLKGERLIQALATLDCPILLFD